MAQDYHIYLHSEESGSSGSKTQPFSQRKEENNTFSNAVSTLSSTTRTITNGQLAETGVSSLSKALPAVAAVIAVAKIADHVVSTGFAHQAEYTGNFRNSVNYNNFKTIVGNILNPIGFILKSAHQQAQYNKQNIEIDQQRNLMGSSILKDFNIGV